MDKKLYLRRSLIGWGLAVGFLVVLPFVAIGGTMALCRGSPAEGCGDAGILFFILAIPALIGLLISLFRTMSLRRRFLGLPVMFDILACLLLLGSVRPGIMAIFLVGQHRAPGNWEGSAPLLAIAVAVALYWIPEREGRAPLAPYLWALLIVVGGLALCRLAEDISYPFWMIGGMTVGFAFAHIAAFGPLHFVPTKLVVASFLVLLVIIVLRWRSTSNTAANS